ncbi:unnamed protein product, partial [Candidula unifasciata]
HQASEMTSALKAKVKSAATLLQQRKMLQRNLRSLQQHSLSREILSSYRSRLHALPAPQMIKSMSPMVNERMRKRRCFADKELEMVMLERERQTELKNQQLAFHHAQRQAVIDRSFQQCQTDFDIAKSRLLLGNMSPRDFLQRVFPTHNPNLLELVWQGCGGNLERAIEQLASELKASHPVIAALGPSLFGTRSASLCQGFPLSPMSSSSVVLPSIHDSTSSAKFFSMYPLMFPSPLLFPQSIRGGSDLRPTETANDLRVDTKRSVKTLCNVLNPKVSDHDYRSGSDSPIQQPEQASSIDHHCDTNDTCPASPVAPDMLSPASTSSSLSSLELEPVLPPSLLSPSWKSTSDTIRKTYGRPSNPFSIKHSTDGNTSEHSSSSGAQTNAHTNVPDREYPSISAAASNCIAERYNDQTARKAPYLKFSVEAIMSRT